MIRSFRQNGYVQAYWPMATRLSLGFFTSIKRLDFYSTRDGLPVHRRQPRSQGFLLGKGPWERGCIAGPPSNLVHRYPSIQLDEEGLCENIQLFCCCCCCFVLHFVSREHKKNTYAWAERQIISWPLSPNTSPARSFIVSKACTGTRVVNLRSLPLTICICSEKVPIATLKPNFVNTPNDQLSTSSIPWQISVLFTFFICSVLDKHSSTK